MKIIHQSVRLSHAINCLTLYTENAETGFPSYSVDGVANLRLNFKGGNNKMGKTLKRIFCLAIVAVMLLIAAAGCSSKKEENQPVQSSTGQASAEASASGTSAAEPADPNMLEWQAETSPVTFTAYMDFNPNAFNGWGKDPVTQEIVKRTGVSIDVTTATTNDSQQLNAMIASGDLPDFVIFDANTAVRTTLWKQGYLQPLNKLIDQYAPKMRTIIPKDMDKIYTEDDGNMYILVGGYSDVDRLANTKGAHQSVGGFAMHMPMYKELGEPACGTLDEYKAVLKTAKEKFPDVKFLSYDGSCEVPQDGIRNMAQLINRIYGGTDYRAIAADGTVHFNFRDETYQKALKYINSLYREKLFSPENFTTTKIEQFQQLAKSNQIFTYWGQCFNIAKIDLSNEGAYKPFEPPQIPGIPLKIKSNLTGIGGWPSVGISVNCKDPKRALLYMEFLMSDEGQFLTYHGIEGVHYTMEDGMPKNTPEKDEAWKDFSKMQQDLGILNYQVAWLSSTWIDNNYYYWLDKGKDAYGLLTSIYSKYAVNERMNDLIKVSSDSPEKVIEQKVLDLWKTMLPKIYLAETEAKCDEAYKEFISKAEKLGLADLEKAYTNNYLSWKQKLGN